MIQETISLDQYNLFALLVLAIICTSFAFLVSTWVMKYVTPFTVAVSVNMEPIYAMILAILIYPDTEKMSMEFYIGALIIIIAVFLNAFFKSKFSTT
jgi:drug/metabolite transporter (DMT)-like permease